MAAKTKSKRAPEPKGAGKHLTVVGIGASAGGLAALRTLFQHTPADSGLSYVVVVHLSPEHRSHLPELLQPHVEMPVQQVTKTVRLEPNRVYVIPPNANLEAVDTHLRLTKLENARGERAPIDHFLRTLAATHDGSCIGVILTGTGGDGTLGLREIKSRSGLTVVQDPAEAEYDGMPRSAIAAGVADRVLPLAEIPQAVVRWARITPEVPDAEDGKKLDGDARSELHTILALVRSRTSRDFTRYKVNTVLRRIARRMHLCHAQSMAEYIEVLRSQLSEVEALADDLLITVTSFFRDPDFYEALEKTVVPRLVGPNGGREDVRVWSVGCSTGEEAYSLAILLLEATSGSGATPPFQVFATDLHEISVERARQGLFPADIQADVSPERLERFFQREGDGYRVRKQVRDLVLFAPHNLLSDPPFSRMDLILCRNLLIYLERDVQDEVAELFHYALRPDGVLALGSAERLDLADLFQAEDRKQGIYRRRGAPAAEIRLPVFPLVPPAPSRGPRPRAPQRSLYGTLHETMAERYALPSLLVSPDDNVAFLSPAAARYLDVKAGALAQSVHRLIREELQMELRQAIHRARGSGESQQARPVGVPLESGAERVTMTVTPSDHAEEGDYLCVTFDARPAPPPPDPSTDGGEPGEQGGGRLAAERDEARHRLEALGEEYETSREEMRASNEELQSMNEELRSAMEELETSKEELQSLNEELQSVNEENRHKVEELAQLSGDLQNLLSATGIATIFLDRRLRILRFTPKVAELFNVRETDRGRPLADLTHHLVDAEIVEGARAVLRTLVPTDRELHDEDGRWYLTRILPYRSEEDRIEGVVITLVDITFRKQAEEKLRAAQGDLAQELFTSRRLYDMTAQALTATGTEEMLHEVLNAAVDLLGADFGTMQLMKGGGLEVVAQSGLSQRFLDAFERVTADDASVCARVLGTGRRVVVPDVAADPELEALHDVFAAAGVRGVQSTPLVSRRGEILGVLSTHYSEPHELSERDARLADVVAQQASDVIERIRGEQEMQRLNETLEERVAERTAEVRDLAGALSLAEQEERRRISELLHEDLQQLLYGIQVTLAHAHKKGEGGDTGALLTQTSKSLELLGDAVARTRQLSVDLSPPVLEGDGLLEALEWLRPQMHDLHGLDVEVQAPESTIASSREVMILVFTTVRELLFNVAKHAGVSRAVVEVEEGPNGLAISVADEGDGFDPASLANSGAGVGGLGLAGARQRLRFHGGDLRIESAPGDGTRITLLLPSTGDA
ncbi:MAG TPA: chemotaxis protein CheB [Longimicrobiales bacterium]|nr:chemotaxis protein CheB [Longimicrobiales bacterium]